MTVNSGLEQSILDHMPAGYCSYASPKSKVSTIIGLTPRGEFGYLQVTQCELRLWLEINRMPEGPFKWTGTADSMGGLSGCEEDHASVRSVDFRSPQTARNTVHRERTRAERPVFWRG